MTIRETVIRKINEKKFVRRPVTEETDLYRDLSFDSLAFIRLLIELEELYSITYDVLEMESCIRVGRLIALTEQKTGGTNASRSAHQPQ